MWLILKLMLLVMCAGCRELKAYKIIGKVGSYSVSKSAYALSRSSYTPSSIKSGYKSLSSGYKSLSTGYKKSLSVGSSLTSNPFKGLYKSVASPVSRSNSYWDVKTSMTLSPLLVYYLPSSYYNSTGYYSNAYETIYYDGYGYNFYYGDYGYYEYSVNDEPEDTEPGVGYWIGVVTMGYFFIFGLPWAYVTMGGLPEDNKYG